MRNPGNSHTRHTRTRPRGGALALKSTRTRHKVYLNGGSPLRRDYYARSRSKGHRAKILALADVRLDGTRPWDITVYNEDFYPRVLRLGSLGLGESYMDSWWDCRALDEFFCRILSAGLERDGAHNWRFACRYLLASAFNRQTRTRARQVADQHYDLGNQLYLNMLDRRMVYTCARWGHVSRLDEAQEVKLDFVCQKLGLRPGMHLLDIGCGWGSLARFAVQKYGVRVTGVTLSRFLSTIGSTHSVRTDPWIEKYVFPNSHLPSPMQISRAIEGLFAVEDWENWGSDYDRTVMAWFQNFDKNWDKLKSRYDARFYRMWKYCLMAAAASFRSRKNQVWQILLSRQ